MRDDLLDAQAAIDWAVAHIPRLEERIAGYEGSRPYVIEMEPDPKHTGDVLMVFYSLGAPDALINADVGAIINSLRSSLDILFASLIARNGVIFNRNAHFPIRGRPAHFLGELKAMKNKKWLSKSEVAAIKRLRPYKGRDRTLWTLNQLDIMRKHRKLIEIRPNPGTLSMPMFIGGSQPVWRHLKDKTILLRCPPGTNFCPAKADCKVAIQIAFDEPALRLKHAPVVPVLRHFADAVQSVVSLFDAS